MYGEDGRVVDVVEKAGVVDLRYPSLLSNDAVVGLYAYSPDVFDVILGPRRRRVGELEITDVNRHYAEQGTLACHRVKGSWEVRGHAGVSSRDRRAYRPHRRQQGRTVIDGLLRIPLQRFEDERGWFYGAPAREPVAEADEADERLVFPPARIRGPSLPVAQRGQDDLFVCMQGTARVVVLDRDTGEAFTEDIGDENPVAIYVPGNETPTDSRRSPISSATT